MLTIEKSTREITGLHPGEVPEEVLNSNEPLLLKGMVAQWPIVHAAKESAQSADRYLRRFYQNATVGAFFGAPDTGGRVFYNDDMTGFNFQRMMLKLDKILDKIQQHSYDDRPPALYVGSTTVDTCLPGFRPENDIEYSGFFAVACFRNISG